MQPSEEVLRRPEGNTKIMVGNTELFIKNGKFRAIRFHFGRPQKVQYFTVENLEDAELFTTALLSAANGVEQLISNLKAGKYATN